MATPNGNTLSNTGKSIRTIAGGIGPKGGSLPRDGVGRHAVPPDGTGDRPVGVPILSIVAPVYNEVASLRELARRCTLAAHVVTPHFELVLVDDGSRDGTGALLSALATDPTVGATLRPVFMRKNGGQYPATIAGLRAARGDCVVVLDGDLQDPPELIGELTRALEVQGRANIAFAVKTARDDAAWMRVACGLLHVLQRWLSPVATVHGAGSFCALRRCVVRRVIDLPVENANLGAVLAALCEPYTVVPYAKHARVHGDSRVGLVGLVREAWGSLAVTGALQRLAWFGAACTLVATSAALAFAAAR